MPVAGSQNQSTVGRMNELERVKLGKSDLRITRVGVGTAPIGSTSKWHVYWGPQNEDMAIKAIRTALDLGVNWIDTAPFYGWGRAEEIVGKAIKGRRDQVYIFTKCGTLPNGKGGSLENLSPENIKRELDASLKRLGTNYVDLLQFHDPDPATPIEESWRTMQELIGEGKIRYGGLSNHPVDLLERALKIGPVTSNQVQYNPLERSIESGMMPFCQRNGIGILGWGSLAEGFLTDNFDLDGLDSKDFRRNHRYGQPGNYVKIVKIREALGRIARKRGKRVVDLVVAWELMHPALTAAIIGIRNEKEAGEMLAGSVWNLDSGEMAAVRDALIIWERPA